MIQTQPRPSHVANWRRTVHDDAPELVQIQPGIEAVPVASGLEQIPAENHPHTQAPQVVLGEEEKEILAEHDPGPLERRQSVCGMSRKWFWILVAAVLVAIATAVAVGVTVRAKQAQKNSL